MNFNFIDTKKKKFPVIGDLRYGTIIGNAPGHPESIYIKVNKKVGMGVSINWTQHHCLLLNLKTGGIRQIPADSTVTVYEGDLDLLPCENLSIYLRDSQ